MAGRLASWQPTRARGVENGAHAPLSTLARAPFAAHRMQLAVGEFHRLIGIERLGGIARLLFQCGGNALAAADELEVALVGEHDGLGPPARADHDRFGVSARPAEALEQRGQLRARFPRGENVVRFAIHTERG